MVVEKKKTKKQLFAEAASNAFSELQHTLSSIAAIPAEQITSKDRFIDAYSKCELIYKQLYPKYKSAKDGTKIDVKKLDINVQLIEASLRWCDIQYDDNEVKAIFSADKAYKEKGHRACVLLRNNILHNMDPESIQEVHERIDELMDLMNRFIGNATT